MDGRSPRRRLFREGGRGARSYERTGRVLPVGSLGSVRLISSPRRESISWPNQTDSDPPPHTLRLEALSISPTVAPIDNIHNDLHTTDQNVLPPDAAATAAATAAAAAACSCLAPLLPLLLPLPPRIGPHPSPLLSPTAAITAAAAAADGASVLSAAGSDAGGAASLVPCRRPLKL